MRSAGFLSAVLGVVIAVAGCATRQPVPDTSSSCPSSSQLLAAWHGAPSDVRQSWAAPTTDITGFAGTRCWNGWAVAAPVGNGNGTFVFSQAGGLHLLPVSELRNFDDAVCASPDAPAGWKNPAAGPANCR